LEKKKFIITSHARQRFCERMLKHPSEKVEEYLQNATNRFFINEKIEEHLVDVEENKSYINNTVLMQRLYKNHGLDGRYEMLVNKKTKVLFINKITTSSAITKNVLVTCYPLNGRFLLCDVLNIHEKPTVKDGIKPNKFRSRKKKRRYQR
jgi:hypothetical protein